ncbi:MAG: amylo-alpha-1,6-glucosidase [Spirochaetia bacterium]
MNDNIDTASDFSENGALGREWILTNGLGGYSFGTVGGYRTRRYHGLLVAALEPPVGRYLLCPAVNEGLSHGGRDWRLGSFHWNDGTYDPQGFVHLERFELHDGIPTWFYAIGDLTLMKRVEMAQGRNEVTLSYQLLGSESGAGDAGRARDARSAVAAEGGLSEAPAGNHNPATASELSVTLFGAYRDHHGQGVGCEMYAQSVAGDTDATAPTEVHVYQVDNDQAVLCFAVKDSEDARLEAGDAGARYWNARLELERYRGLPASEELWPAARAVLPLRLGDPAVQVVISAAGPESPRGGDRDPRAEPGAAARPGPRPATRSATRPRMALGSGTVPVSNRLQTLRRAAGSFLVERTLENGELGSTIIAGYPWFGDWGRDTMISLPGLTLATHNYEATRAYFEHTGDIDTLTKVLPVLRSILENYDKGTRYGIHVDPADGLLCAGEEGVQLTWMDARVGEQVITPRSGKAVEINALWHHALVCYVALARAAESDDSALSLQLWEDRAHTVEEGFAAAFYNDLGYLNDVVDTLPHGEVDATIRPNQVFVLSLQYERMRSGITETHALLSQAQAHSVLQCVSRHLYTPVGLRSISPADARYRGRYGGSPGERDGSYHQGPVWGWLLGPYLRARLALGAAHQEIYRLLERVDQRLGTGCLGTLSEIYDGDAPHHDRGAPSQAWSVAELLWTEYQLHASQPQNNGSFA